MTAHVSFSSSTCEEQMHTARRELSAFLRAVTEMFGPETARRAAADWLDECELMDSPSLSTDRNWRAVTIAASARLANRVTTASNQPNPAISNGSCGADLGRAQFSQPCSLPRGEPSFPNRDFNKVGSIVRN